jgi:hypothetical protein
MISIFFLPITFFLIYKDQKTGKIELYYWKVLFLCTFSFLLFIDPQKILLVLEIFARYGIIILIFLLFFILIKIYGGADVLFLLFLFFSATNRFLIEIYFNFLFFLKNLAIFAILGMANNGLFISANQILEKNTISCKVLEFPIRNKSKSFPSPQFFFIFLSFL